MARKSKRELVDAIEELEPEPPYEGPEEYPELPAWTAFFRWDLTLVDEQKSLYKREETGDIYYQPERINGNTLSEALAERK